MSSLELDIQNEAASGPSISRSCSRGGVSSAISERLRASTARRITPTLIRSPASIFSYRRIVTASSTSVSSCGNFSLVRRNTHLRAVENSAVDRSPFELRQQALIACLAVCKRAPSPAARTVGVLT
jgi:hypothetical protein